MTDAEPLLHFDPITNDDRRKALEYARSGALVSAGSYVRAYEAALSRTEKERDEAREALKDCEPTLAYFADEVMEDWEEDERDTPCDSAELCRYLVCKATGCINNRLRRARQALREKDDE